MPARPGTGQQKATAASLSGKLRPHSAAVLSAVLESPPCTATAGKNGERVGATSDELIRDLEQKVRKVVELKRAKSDKLHFEVTKKREEVEKAKLVLQDLIKDSEALGLHYHPCDHVTEEGKEHSDRHDKMVEEPNRLKPIASISRRPVYSKHTKINELEAKLEKQARASHEVLRSTMVLEHIKKRLLNERLEVAQDTNELKIRFADLSHQTVELQKKEIIASEAVSQIQTRLAQQKADMAANLRRYKREVEMRQKWSREKAKFEKYYNNQMQTLIDAQGQDRNTEKAVGIASASKKSSDVRQSPSSLLPPKTRENSISSIDSSEEIEPEEMYRQAFLRMGFGHDSEGVDPDEIIQTWLSHEKLKKDLDAKHDEDIERIAVLRDQLTKLKNAAVERVPLSKRGTSQRLETKEIELSSVERALATVVDQYMYVDQSVRPLKIGLQEIINSVRNEMVDIDDMTAIEHALFSSIEEMMNFAREARNEPDGLPSRFEACNDPVISPKEEVTVDTSKTDKKNCAVFTDQISSPFNIRIPPKPKEPYFVLGVSTAPATGEEPVIHKEMEELDFDVMDRSTVKRISSVLVCTSTGKKSKLDEGHPTQLSK